MPNYSPRDTLDRQIQQILDEVLVMGNLVEQAITDSVDSLKNRDIKASELIYIGDLKVNKKRYELENRCITLIATQQPLARDLRILAAVLEVITELERIGDYAKGIARINVMIGDEPLVKPLIDLPRMADIARKMLQESLIAFVHWDEQAARKIPDDDELVDGLYNQIYRELITLMIADPTKIDRANYLLWVAHNLERIADRVTNICERIIFVVTGEMIEMDQTDDESMYRKPG